MRNIIINTSANSTTETRLGSNRAFDIVATCNGFMRLYLDAKHAMAQAHHHALRLRDERAGQQAGSERSGLKRSGPMRPKVRSFVVPVSVPSWLPILALPQQNVC